MFQRIINLQQPPVLLRLGPNEDVSFKSSGEHSRVFGSPDVRREVAFRIVLARKTGSYRATAIVEHDGGVEQPGAHCVVGVLWEGGARGNAVGGRWRLGFPEEVARSSWHGGRAEDEEHRLMVWNDCGFEIDIYHFRIGGVDANPKSLGCCCCVGRTFRQGGGNHHLNALGSLAL